MPVEGDEWKKKTYLGEEVPVGAVYRLGDLLLDHVVRSGNFVEAYLVAIDSFRPSRTPPKAWDRECLDRLVDGYINNDVVFIRINSGVPWNKYLQVRSAYRDALYDSLTAGEWRDDAVGWLREYLSSRRNDKKDG